MRMAAFCANEYLDFLINDRIVWLNPQPHPAPAATCAASAATANYGSNELAPGVS